MDQTKNVNWTNLVFYMDLFLEKSIYGRFQSLLYFQLIEAIQISIPCSERLQERNTWSHGENELKQLPACLNIYHNAKRLWFFPCWNFWSFLCMS